MSDFLMQKKDKKTFQDIVFAHLERILEMTKFEFTGGYYNQVITGNLTKNEYVGDKKEEYCQLVEALSDILMPWFDKDMKKAHLDYKTKIKAAESKIYSEDWTPKNEDNYKNDYQTYSKQRLVLTRELFQNLNMLLSRINYLSKKLTGFRGDVLDVDAEVEENNTEIADIDENRT